MVIGQGCISLRPVNRGVELDSIYIIVMTTVQPRGTNMTSTALDFLFFFIVLKREWSLSSEGGSG